MTAAMINMYSNYKKGRSLNIMKCFFFCTSHNCCMDECKIPRWICLRLCKNLKKKKRDKLLAFRFKVFSCDAIENTLVTVWISINSIMSIQFLKGDATQKLKGFENSSHFLGKFTVDIGSQFKRFFYLRVSL